MACFFNIAQWIAHGSLPFVSAYSLQHLSHAVDSCLQLGDLGCNHWRVSWHLIANIRSLRLQIAYFVPLPVFSRAVGSNTQPNQRELQCFELILPMGLKHVQMSTASGLPGYDHPPVSCSFKLSLRNSYPTKPKTYFRADWGRLPILVRNSNRDSLFLMPETPAAAD